MHHLNHGFYYVLTFEMQIRELLENLDFFIGCTNSVILAVPCAFQFFVVLPH